MQRLFVTTASPAQEVSNVSDGAIVIIVVDIVFKRRCLLQLALATPPLRYLKI